MTPATQRTGGAPESADSPPQVLAHPSHVEQVRPGGRAAPIGAVDLRSRVKLPSFFRAALARAASRGFQGVSGDRAIYANYKSAGWTLATRWSDELPSEIPEDKANAAEERLAVIAKMRAGQAESALIRWMTEYLPDFLHAVPARRRRGFTRGFMQRVEGDL